MPLSSVLMRLPLCLSLVMNGSGYAAAAVTMRVEHAAALAAVHQAPEAGRTAPCPEHAGVTSGDDHAAVPDSVTHEHHNPDCCKSAKCACLQHAPAAIFVQWIGPAVIEHSDAVRQMKAAHETPALPHEIRPPIG